MALIDNEKLYENIEKKLELIKAAKEQPVIMKPFIKDFAYRFCWSSNALEGNTLSLDETICLIDYDEVRSGHTYTEYQEAKNLYKAIKKEMLPLQKREITEAWIKEANGEIIETDHGAVLQGMCHESQRDDRTDHQCNGSMERHPGVRGKGLQ